MENLLCSGFPGTSVICPSILNPFGRVNGSDIPEPVNQGKDTKMEYECFVNGLFLILVWC